MLALLVGIGAAVGAVLRYVIDQIVQRGHDTAFPFGTLTINLTGSFALGLITGLGEHHGLDASVLTVAGAGVLGGYTTFSAWAWESVVLLTDRAVLAMTANITMSLVVGSAAAAAGLGLAQL
jgi:fluoride exporter